MMESLKTENDFMRRENDMLKLQAKELETDVKNLEYTEEVMMLQSQTQKSEINTLRKKIKQSDGTNQVSHIKGSLIQWLTFFSKG